MTKLTATLLLGATSVGLLAVSVAANADTRDPPIVARLMRKPLTRWDWGMYRMEKDLRADSERLKVTYSTSDHQVLMSAPGEILVEYLRSEQRLRVRLNYEELAANISQQEAEGVCTHAIESVRRFLAPMGGFSMFNTWFRFDNSGTEEQPLDLQREIEVITYVRVDVVLADASGAKRTDGLHGFQCGGPLLGRRVDFSDYW